MYRYHSIPLWTYTVYSVLLISNKFCNRGEGGGSRAIMLLNGFRALKLLNRILVRLCCHKKMYFYMKNILYVGYRTTYKVTNYTYAGTKAFWKAGNQVYLLIFLLLDLVPDPHFQYRSGSSRRAISVRIRIHNTYLFLLLLDLSFDQSCPLGHAALYKRKCWTISGGPLVNSLLWGVKPRFLFVFVA